MELRYLDTTNLMKPGLIAESQGITGHKAKAVEQCGFDIAAEEHPMDAWMRGLCEINDLEYTKPVCPELRDAILDNSKATKFMFFLA